MEGKRQINYTLDKNETAKRMTKAMEKIDITVTELANKADVSKSTISQYIHAVSSPSNISASKIGKVLGVSPMWLMGFDVDMHYDMFEDQPKRKNRIPVLGQVAAGIPIEMIEDIIDYEGIPAEMAKDGTYFGLQIKGDSMEPRIYDGDVVIVKKQDYCDNNDIAIVTVNGYDATCKRILKSEGGITLMPLNTRHTPQMFTNEQIENIPVRIIGLVVEVRGKLKF